MSIPVLHPTLIYMLPIMHGHTVVNRRVSLKVDDSSGLLTMYPKPVQARLTLLPGCISEQKLSKFSDITGRRNLLHCLMFRVQSAAQASRESQDAKLYLCWPASYPSCFPKKPASTEHLTYPIVLTALILYGDPGIVSVFLHQEFPGTC